MRTRKKVERVPNPAFGAAKIKQIEKDFLMDNNGSNAAIRGKVHFIGIGGCSMNGLAQILRGRGFEVQGSDSTTSPFTKRLEELGIPVFIGHDPKNVEGCGTVIYSAAIKPDNPERVRARELGIPEIERSVALGIISRSYREVIGIAGCHGKTTITSMLALIAENGGLDATVHVGGMVDFLHGGIRLGSHDLFVTEACEYVESFLTLHPTVVLINNIDNDHLDYFKTMDNIVNAFRKFVARMPADGLFVGCTDDSHVRQLLDEFGGRKTTYGLDLTNSPDYYPADVHYDGLGCASFDLMHRGERLGRVTLHVPGQHNMLDAIAASAVALEHGTDIQTVITALARFRSVQRRFEYYGERNGVRVFHDYAHHPAEIRAAMDCALRTPHKSFLLFSNATASPAQERSSPRTLTVSGARTKCLCPIFTPAGRRTTALFTHATWLRASMPKRATPNTYRLLSRLTITCCTMLPPETSF